MFLWTINLCNTRQFMQIITPTSLIGGHCIYCIHEIMNIVKALKLQSKKTKLGNKINNALPHLFYYIIWNLRIIQMILNNLFIELKVFNPGKKEVPQRVNVFRWKFWSGLCRVEFSSLIFFSLSVSRNLFSESLRL